MNTAKWVIPADDEGHHVGSGRILHVGNDTDTGSVAMLTWETPSPTLDRVVRVFPTDQPRDGWNHVGTGIAERGGDVWHLFEWAGAG